MKAMVVGKHGGASVLEVRQLPEPPVGPGQILIAVKAAGVNFADVLARLGLYDAAPKPPSSGRGHQTPADIGSGANDAQRRRRLSGVTMPQRHDGRESPGEREEAGSAALERGFDGILASGVS